jgi:hypothetical protein
MRPILIGLSIFAASALLMAACGQETSGPIGTTTAGSGTGGAPNCDDAFLVYESDASDPCNICMHEHCCAEMAACRAHSCVVCANNSTGPSCGPESRIAEDCANAKCLSTCSPGWTPPTSSTGGE